MSTETTPVDGRSGQTGDENLNSSLARKRTLMAAERTDMALIRTGFTISSFGAGLTQIIGRGVWPDLAVSLLTIVFILAGFMSVQIGLGRLRKQLKDPLGMEDFDRRLRHLLILAVWLLQAALLTIIVMVVVHM